LIDGRLIWRPDGSTEDLAIDLPILFAQVWGR
jgi:hypothetical protein